MNNNKAYLIFRHEFTTTLKRTGFIIMTLAVPLLAVLGIGLYQLISSTVATVAQTVKVGYVDQAGGFDQYTIQGAVTMVLFESTDEARDALTHGAVEEYIVIPSDYISTGVVDRSTLKKELSTLADTQTALENFMVGNMLGGKVSAAVIDRVKAPLNLVTTRLTVSGTVAPDQGGLTAFVIPGAFSLLFALALLFSSTYLLQGLGDEKENRLMEILLSSVSTRQLLIGKVVGLGAAGLVQVLVWVVSAPLLLNLASSTIGGIVATIRLPASFLILAVAYFVLGYAVYAVLSAGAAAVSPTAREGQQLASLFTLCALAPLWGMSLLVSFPDNPVWVVLSIFPLTAPVLMIERFGLADVPVWQIAASMGVLALATVAGLLLAAKVFKSYLLMVGKRPSLREIMKTIRQ